MLTRFKDQSVVIGGDVTVTVLDIRADRVRLGCSAPLDVRIDREEVAEKIAQGGGAPVPTHVRHRDNEARLRTALQILVDKAHPVPPADPDERPVAWAIHCDRNVMDVARAALQRTTKEASR